MQESAAENSIARGRAACGWGTVFLVYGVSTVLYGLLAGVIRSLDLPRLQMAIIYPASLLLCSWQGAARCFGAGSL